MMLVKLAAIIAAIFKIWLVVGREAAAAFGLLTMPIASGPARSPGRLTLPDRSR